MSHSWQTHPCATLFKAYDIRGIVDLELTPDVVYTLGAVLGRQALSLHPAPIIVARDGRLHGKNLSEDLIEGILSSGCDVIDIGCVPTPCLYYATYALKSGHGIMLTGSHNPPEYNGLKIILGGECYAGEAIKALQTACLSPVTPSLKRGSLSTHDITEAYKQAILSQGCLKRPLKVVVDAGHGVAGPLAVELLSALGAKVIPLYCTIDGQFPAHHPNPSVPENLSDLQDAVVMNNADLGVAFDGDGDRLGVVTPAGHIVWPDRVLILLALDLLKRHPNAVIVHDVKCTRHVALCVHAQGGTAVLSKTGHSLIKASMKEEKALLAGEMSGHFFFKEDWYGVDDALLAATKLLRLIAEETRSLDALMNEIPEDVSTPELVIAVDEKEKFGLVDALKCLDYPGATRITLDGLRLHYEEGWALVRASNTTPTLVVRFEARDPEGLESLKNVFKSAFNQVAPALVLPF